MVASAIHPGDAGHHAIAMGDLAHLVRRQEQIVAALLRAQEAETVGIGDHRARDQLGLRRRHIAAAAVLQQLAIAQHRRQPLLQRLETIRRLQPKRARQLGVVQRTLVRGQHLQDHLAAGDRLRVALRLALGMGIGRRHRRAPAGRWRLGHPRRPRAGGAILASRRTPLAACGRGTGGLAGGLAAATAALAWRFAHPAMVQAGR